VHVVVSPSEAEAARAAADAIARLLKNSIAARGTASLALSGGRTPQIMVQMLSTHELAWDSVHLFQVDERAVAMHDPARNWSMLRALVERVPGSNRHPMPVESADADRQYSAELRTITGEPSRLDVVHLGLGTDGHTASLVPGDGALAVVDRDVTWVDPYQGHRRLTLTIPTLFDARHQIWLVTGSAKSAAVGDLTSGDSTTPSALVLNRETATLLVDADAASQIGF
jgi:6-phosphogluconolactonase